MKPEIAVVTGAAGFIGSHMVDHLLAHGYTVHGIDDLSGGDLRNIDHHRTDRNFIFEEIDIRHIQPKNALFKEASYVFHFAGIGDIVPSIAHPIQYHDVNVMGTCHVLEASRHGVIKKLVYAASSSCYGIATELPTTERASIDPKYPYALSKYLGEQAVHHWGKVYHLPVNSIRVFNAYGPRSRTSGAYGAVFGVFLKQKLANQPFTVVGDGSQRRDFIFVTDVVKAFDRVAQSNLSNEIFNLGSGSPQSVNRLVTLLGGSPVYIPKRPGEPDCTWADIAKITSQIGWKPEISFEQGIQTMLDNITYWQDAPLWTPQSIESETREWFKFLTP